MIEVKTNGSTTGTYTYNANGGRTMTSDHGHSHAGVFDDQDRMTQLGDLQFTYNLDGQLQSRTDSSISEAVNYVYDTQGNLLSAALPGSCTISYVTDGMNRRVAKKHNGDLEDQYVFEDSLRIAGKLGASGNLVQRYVYGTMLHSPDVILENGRTLRVITDHLGSPRLIVNSQTGEILRSMNHDAWGRVLEDSNPMFSPHGFAGGIYDSDTKLVLFGARSYDPEVGRWLSKDPILFAGGDTNLYGYAMNDPVNFIDPYGLKSFAENLAARQEMRNQFASTLVRTGTSLAIGSAFAQNLQRYGLGVTLGELIRNRGLVPGVGGLTNGLLNFGLTTLVKSSLVGAAFAGGALAGEYIGAGIDTYVDNNGGQCNALSGAGFGSQ